MYVERTYKYVSQSLRYGVHRICASLYIVNYFYFLLDWFRASEIITPPPPLTLRRAVLWILS